MRGCAPAPLAGRREEADLREIDAVSSGFLQRGLKTSARAYCSWLRAFSEVQPNASCWSMM